MVIPGSTFQSNHLYVVISDPAKHSGKCVLVNLTTQRAASDTTCVLVAKDFPSFIHHPTVFNYSDAILADVASIEKIINEGLVRSHPDMEARVLQRVVAGALSSPAFPTGLKKYL